MTMPWQEVVAASLRAGRGLKLGPLPCEREQPNVAASLRAGRGLKLLVRRSRHQSLPWRPVFGLAVD